ncbi:MAG: phosphatidylinositol mannoside acyltransferase [Actinomyces ruminicola]|uniref:KDO2-lipid IV(A) lauroyltransferase n=1 Tax=Actinomyces ruminicola TaxID=332524 RepID=A0A1G9Y5D9_9ACTO|nr:phosphatidylinositol mannoside acyltransferase [Actinomyces ruminicola]MBE6481844.1 phosphatidylinositol mannoside acyltransferase [Actinomyces ruminicola]SDN03771.1 KDO2-lipid IV(A) lauroyltransferase [Actinomyces ruminicola]
MSVGIEDLYRLAWRHVRKLPAPVGYGLSALGADAVWLLHRLRGGEKGVGQLEKNLARVLPPDTPAREVRRVSRAGMRSYMRYFYEAFALPGMSLEQLRARVRPDIDPRVYTDISRGSIVIALPHMGNWDLAGAWAGQELAQVLTVAERLEPADLFEQFVSFREGLGMKVIGQGRGEKVFDQLIQTAQEGRYVVALLADRDLSSSGVQTDLGGHRARVAAGPAALAARLELPLYSASLHYERLEGERRRRAGSPWGIVLTIRPVAAPEGLEGREQVAAWTRSWVDDLSPRLAEHAVDWHMLQAVFDADLDPARLARRHAAEAAQQRAGGAEQEPQP